MDTGNFRGFMNAIGRERAYVWPVDKGAKKVCTTQHQGYSQLHHSHHLHCQLLFNQLLNGQFHYSLLHWVYNGIHLVYIGIINCVQCILDMFYRVRDLFTVGWWVMTQCCLPENDGQTTDAVNLLREIYHWQQRVWSLELVSLRQHLKVMEIYISQIHRVEGRQRENGPRVVECMYYDIMHEIVTGRNVIRVVTDCWWWDTESIERITCYLSYGTCYP